MSLGEMRAKWDKRYFLLYRDRLRYFKSPDDPLTGQPERGKQLVCDVWV